MYHYEIQKNEPAKIIGLIIVSISIVFFILALIARAIYDNMIMYRRLYLISCICVIMHSILHMIFWINIFSYINMCVLVLYAFMTIVTYYNIHGTPFIIMVILIILIHVIEITLYILYIHNH